MAYLNYKWPPNLICFSSTHPLEDYRDLPYMMQPVPCHLCHSYDHHIDMCSSQQGNELFRKCIRTRCTNILSLVEAYATQEEGKFLSQTRQNSTNIYEELVQDRDLPTMLEEKSMMALVMMSKPTSPLPSIA